VGHSVETKTNIAAAFIGRWQKSGASERANFQSFLTELWPKALPEQVQAVRTQLAARAAPIAAADLTRAFKGARSDRVAEVLVTLAALGQARVTDGKFVASL